MAYPAGYDSFDQYMAQMYKRQGLNSSKSASAPATRQAMAQPHAPSGQIEGPGSSVGKSLMNTAGQQVTQRGTNAMMDWISKYMSGGNPGTGGYGGPGTGGPDTGFIDAGAGAGGMGAEAGADGLGSTADWASMIGFA